MADFDFDLLFGEDRNEPPPGFKRIEIPDPAPPALPSTALEEIETQNRAAPPPGYQPVTPTYAPDFSTQIGTARDSELDRIKQHILTAEDPRAEREKMAVAAYANEMYGLDAKLVYENYDAVVQELFGRDMGPGTALGEMRDRWRTGNLMAELGMLYFEQSQGNTSEAIQERITELEAALPSYEEMYDSLPATWAKALLEQFGQWNQTLRKGAVSGLVMAGEFAAGMAILGQAGPQAALGEEVVTVPSAAITGYMLGQAIGTARAVMAMEGGLLWRDLVMDPELTHVPDELRRQAVLAVGGFNALIEILQIGSIPGIDKMIARASRTAARRLIASRGFVPILTRAAGRLTTHTLTEVGEEVLQESATMLAEEMIRDLDAELSGGQYATDWEQVKQRILDTAAQSAMTFGTIGLPGISFQAVQDVQQRNLGRTEVLSPRAEEAVRALRDYGSRREEAGAQGMSAQEFDQRLEEIKDTAQTDPAGALQQAVQLAEQASSSDVEALTEGTSQRREAGPQPHQMTPEEYAAHQAQQNASAAPPVAGTEAPSGPVTQAAQDPQLRAAIQQLAPEFTPEQLDLAAGLVGVVQTVNPETTVGVAELTEDVANLNPEQQAARGVTTAAIRSIDSSTFEILLNERSTFADWVHEIGHIVQKNLTGEQLAIFEKHYSRDGQVDFEAANRDWERFVYNGEISNPELQPLFTRMAQALRQFVEYFMQTVGIRAVPADVANVYNEILSNPRSPISEVGRQGTQFNTQQGETFRAFRGEDTVLDQGRVNTYRQAPPFTLQRRVAEAYTEGFEGSRVIEADVSFRNPYRFGAEEGVVLQEDLDRINADLGTNITMDQVESEGSRLNREEDPSGVAYAETFTIADLEGVVDAARAAGHDGLIFPGAFEPPDFEFEIDEQAPLELRPFSPSQIRPVDGAELQFNSAKETLERNRLVAHNISGDDILKVSELGGMVMPSLAVTNTKNPHLAFGEISIVFPHEVLKDSRVFDRDIYSVRVPQPVMEPNFEAAQTVTAWIDSSPVAGDRVLDNDYLRTELMRSTTQQQFKDRLTDMPVVQVKFMVEAFDYELPMVGDQNPAMKELLEEILANPEAGPKDLLSELFSAYVEREYSKGLPQDQVADRIEALTKSPKRLEIELRSVFVVARELAREPARIDRAQIRQDIASSIDYDQMFQWLEEQSLPRVMENPMLQTELGETVPYTPENILEHMAAQAVRGSEQRTEWTAAKANAMGAEELLTVDRIRQTVDSRVDTVARSRELGRFQLLEKDVELSLVHAAPETHTSQAMRLIYKAAARYNEKDGRTKKQRRAELERQLDRQGWAPFNEDQAAEVGGRIGVDNPTIADVAVYLSEQSEAIALQYLEGKHQGILDLTDAAFIVAPDNVDDNVMDLLTGLSGAGVKVGFFQAEGVLSKSQSTEANRRRWAMVQDMAAQTEEVLFNTITRETPQANEEILGDAIIERRQWPEPGTKEVIARITPDVARNYLQPLGVAADNWEGLGASLLWEPGAQDWVVGAVADITDLLAEDRGSAVADYNLPDAYARSLTEGEDFHDRLQAQTSRLGERLERADPEKMLELISMTPDIKPILASMSVEEAGKLKANTSQKIVELYNLLPGEKEFAAVAISGQAKRGWYKNSAEALVTIFGADAPRFARLLAATSPQTSVESNLTNSLGIWAGWIEAGRPTDAATITQIMRDNVLGDSEDPVLPAWIPNTLRALQSEDPLNETLSGPKVDSFARNLMGEVDSVTLDTWMGHFALWKQKNFGGALNVAGTDPGKGTGYLAYSAVVRDAALAASEMTGETWTPAEIQETVWSWAKTLLEMTLAKGENRTAEQILKAGDLTHEAIAATPDFQQLFTQGVYRQLLERAGYDTEVLSGTRTDSGEGGRGALTGSAATLPEGASIAERTFRGHLYRAARRLDSLAAARRIGKDAVAELEFNTRPVTESDAFRSWFGDSKVVDQNGRPLVVYHGTTREFSVFRRDLRRGRDRSVTRSFGFFFTEDQVDAQRYAEWNGALGTLMPVYLSIQNPYHMTEQQWADLSNYTWDQMRAAEFKFSDEQREIWIREALERVNATRAELMKRGHDGIVIDVPGVHEYVAFDSTQIKSAGENQGSFNPDDPDIYFNTRQESEHERLVREAVERGSWVPDKVLEAYKDVDWAIAEADNRDQLRAEAREAIEQGQDPDDFALMSSAMSLGTETQEYWQEIYRTADQKVSLRSPEEIADNWIRDLSRETLSSYLREIVAAGEADQLSDPIIRGIALNIGETRTLTERQFKKVMDKIRFDPVSWNQELSALTDNIDDLRLMHEALETHPTSNELQRRRDEISTLKRRLEDAKVTADGLRRNLEIDRKYEADLKRYIAALEQQNLEIANSAAADLDEALDNQRATQRILRKEITAERARHRDTIQKLARARAKAESFQEALKTAIADAKVQAREIRREVRAQIEARRLIDGMIKSIMKRPAATIDYSFAKQIMEIQRQHDVRSHQRGRYARVFKEIRDSLQGIDPGELQRMVDEAIGTTSLRDMSLEDLIQLYEQVEDLKREGRALREKKLAQRRKQDLADIRRMLDQIGYTPESARALAQNIGQQFREDQQKKGLGRTIQFQLYNMKRITDALGPAWKRLFDTDINKLTDQKLRQKFARLERLEQIKKQLGVRTRELIRPATERYSVEEVMGIYIAMQNDDSWAAVLHGNGLTQAELDAAERFLAANPKFARFADALMDTFDDASFERLQEAFIESTNTAMARVVNYFPMRRLTTTQTKYDEDVSFDLTSRSFAGRTYVWRGFSHSRKKIADQHQHPIRLDAYKVLLEGVEQQEHYAAFATHIKRLQRLLSSDELSYAFSDKYGSKAWEVMKEYVNRVANPGVTQMVKGFERLLQQARTNMVVGALAYNLMSPIKNLVGPLLYLPHIARGNALTTVMAMPMLVAQILRFMSPTNLYTEGGKLKHRMVEEVFERNPQARHRALDPNLREAQALRYRGANGVMKRITAAGMLPLQWIDTWTIVVGEQSVYHMERLFSGDETAAAGAAQEATLRTQPFGEEKDSPAAYTSNWFKAMAMFSSPLNQIFGMMTNDFTRDVARGKIGKASLTVASLAMTGILMSMFEKKELPDPEEDPVEFWLDVNSQFIEMIPILGPEFMGALRGSPFVGKGFTLVGWARYLSPTFRRAFDPESDFDEQLDSAVRLITAMTQPLGLPAVGTRRLYEMFATDDGDIDLWALFGGAPEEE